MNNHIEEKIKGAKKRLLELPPDKWKEISDNLQTNSEYQPRQMRKNLHLVLSELGFPLPFTDEITDASFEPFQREEDPNSTGNHLTADRLFALASRQLDWFKELQEEVASRLQPSS